MMKWIAINPGLLASTMSRGPASLLGPTPSAHSAVQLTTQCALAFLEPPSAPQRHAPPPPRKQHPYPVCYAWNRGTCPYGNFRHVCLSCSSSSHKSGDCPQAPPPPHMGSVHPRQEDARTDPVPGSSVWIAIAT